MNYLIIDLRITAETNKDDEVQQPYQKKKENTYSYCIITEDIITESEEDDDSDSDESDISDSV